MRITENARSGFPGCPEERGSDDFAAVMAGLAKLEESGLSSLSKPIGDDL
jgi:hypothetical protein